MEKEIAIIDDQLDSMVTAFDEGNEEALMAITGQETSSKRDDLSKLSINYETETDDGKTLKKGLWRVWYEGRYVYGSEVSLRVLLRTFKWTLWDSAEGTSACSSIQKPHLAGEFPDSAGGDKCGRLPKDEADSLEEDDPRLLTSKTVACNQVIYGRLTANMKDADGQDVEIKDLPIVGYFKRSGFMPMNNFINGLSRQKKIMQRVWVNLTTSKLKKGSVTFFVPVPTEGDSIPSVPDEDKELLKMFAEVVKAGNQSVMKQYREAQKAVSSDEDIDLSRDFDVDAA